ncbi:AEC family transporter [Arenibaculum pallidiluteum]|uniref:AEC family transporter n=1 Tax=Arenibaculum pallidiluteum TaxID=2812559 RepID=UPI001A967401|nr:AEC family transporter [Arenibaculum pallidiluteum]
MSAIAAVMAPVFIVAALGFGWTRARLPFDRAFVTTFVVNVATPCLVFSTLTRLRAEASDVTALALAAATAVLLAGGSGALAMLALRLPLRPYVPAFAFPNAGNMGIPICLFAFGETGIGYAVVFFTVLAVFQFTLGPAIAAGRADLRQLLSTPLVPVVIVALAVRATGLPLPAWLTNTTGLLGNCAVPLMLVSLGVALAGLRLKGTVRALALSALRLATGAAAGWAAATAFGLEGTMRSVVILQSAMPVAVFNYLWAAKFDNAPEDVASMVIASTVLAMLLLPVLLVFLAPG